MWFQNFSQINLVYEPLLLTQSTFWMFLLWRFKTKMLTLQRSLRKSCPSSGTVCGTPSRPVVRQFRSPSWQHWRSCPGKVTTRARRAVRVGYLLTLCTVLHWYSVYCTGRPGGHPPDPTSSLLYTFAFICFMFLMAFETFLFRRSVYDTLLLIIT